MTNNSLEGESKGQRGITWPGVAIRDSQTREQGRTFRHLVGQGHDPTRCHLQVSFKPQHNATQLMRAIGRAGTGQGEPVRDWWGFVSSRERLVFGHRSLVWKYYVPTPLCSMYSNHSVPSVPEARQGSCSCSCSMQPAPPCYLTKYLSS
ncbi:hypothetical protein LZ30DRAFT_439115 [Colletotrichum cereale]|nr:hypothetical protein LZ30DRAFT_439115 [Colletotrichum cereale]